MIMAWGKESNLIERWEAAKDFLKLERKHWKLGSSYDGWVSAQIREAPRIMPLIILRLRKLMLELPPRQPANRWNAFAVDGSQIACPRTAANQKAMGDVGKPNGIPQMSLTSMLHLGTGLPWDFRVGPGADSERAHLRDMLDELPESSLLVADAGFVGYELCRDLIARKQHFLLRIGGNVHLLNQLGYDYEVDGQTVYLWPTEQQNKNQPPIRLRLIVVKDENKLPVYLVVSVLDPDELSDEEASGTYRQRWGIEVQYRTTKQTMQHHTMRSRTPETCYLEMKWAFLGVWLLQLMTARAIAADGDNPQRASTAQARNTVRRVMRGGTPIPRSRKGFRRVLAQCLIDDYERLRPKSSRQYPRKKRHKPPDPPKIKPPTHIQLHKAKQLAPLVILI